MDLIQIKWIKGHLQDSKGIWGVTGYYARRRVSKAEGFNTDLIDLRAFTGFTADLGCDQILGMKESC